MKDNTFLKLFIIIIISLLFRLWFLDKPEGLWNDEYVSWYISSQKSISDLFTEMFKNCHTPFYYFYLKSWMTIFNDSDISLRLSSVFVSVLSVIAMFFLGKELKNSTLGLLCSFITAISSFCIYFSQEVRLYSLLFLLTSLTILFFIRCIKIQSKINLLLFFIFNALLCAVHTLGIIFSFFNIIVLFVYLYKYVDEYNNKFKNIIKIVKYVFPFILIILLIAPLLFTIAFSSSLSQFWSYFSISKIFFVFSDYFSPIQINIINSPDSIINYVLKNGAFNYIFIIFSLIPLLIGIFFIIYAVRQKNLILNSLLISSMLFFAVLVILSAIGKMILITKYSCEIYPVLILAFSYGIFSLKNIKIRNILFSLFIGINLFYLIFSNYRAPKMTRPEGHRAAVKLIENSRLKNSDYVILTYYDVNKFKKYLEDEEKYRFSSINKLNFNTIMFNNDNYFETIEYGKNIYKDYFREFPNKTILKYVYDNYISKMKKGEKIGIILLNSVSFISNDKLQNIINDDKEYNRTPFIFISFSALRNSLLYSFKNDYKIDSITTSGEWTLIVYEKIN